MAKKLTSKKARQILHDKEVHGQPLTDKQRRFFGAIASGAKPYKAKSGGWLDKYDKAQDGDAVPAYALRPMTGDITARAPRLLEAIEIQEAKERQAQAARTRTTISADTRTPVQKRRDAEATVARRKYEEEVLGNDLSMPSDEKARNRAQAERIIHNLVDVPLTLMPVGELAYLGSKGVAKIAPKVGEYLTTQTPLRNAYKYNPWAFKPNPEAYYRGVGKEGMEDIFQSGVIRSKKQHAYPDPYFSKGVIGDKYAKGYFAELTGEPMKGVGSFPEGSLIQTPVNTVGINNPNLKLYKQDWLRGYKEVPKPKKQGGIVKAKNGIEGTMGGLTDVGFNYNGAWGGTMQDGGNLQPAMAGAVQTVPMYAVGGSVPGSVGFTYARAAGAAPSEGPYAKKTMPSAQTGAMMRYYQEGLDFKPKTISQDGITIDPMGYWNPENVGEPVIIPSNIITMEGVNQPLIGISDTGDIQYMEPGEDYEFEGESVLEVPVARKGVSVNNADAQPIKKLDQLLNFTNYNKPTRGGWLSKYE